MQEICGRSQLKFERAYLHDFWDEAIALTQLNHAETGGLPYEDFNPDKDKYLKIEEIGLIVSFTLRSAGATGVKPSDTFIGGGGATGARGVVG